jgi:hypothetical protein
MGQMETLWQSFPVDNVVATLPLTYERGRKGNAFCKEKCQHVDDLEIGKQRRTQGLCSRLVAIL